jgi:transposase
MQYIAFDAHKRYTHVRVEDESGRRLDERRIEHWKDAVRGYLTGWDEESPVAIETVGNWYWIVDEIEQAKMRPQLVHARKAKLMMAMVNKSDRLDCAGMNKLQRTGTLPTVWIPPGELRHIRELTRTRTVLVRERTRMKNRIHATLSKYGIRIEGVSDLFGKRGLVLLDQEIRKLSEEVRETTEVLIEQVQYLNEKITYFEKRIKERMAESEELRLLQSIPGVGFVLAAVILLEVGKVSRFSRAEKLAAYSGTTPRIHQSGQTRRYGPVRNDVNRYLKHAFVEAANAVCMHRSHPRFRHVGNLYDRMKHRKGHQKAIGAVARHLAEATYWILTKKEEYRAPKGKKATVVSTQG